MNHIVILAAGKGSRMQSPLPKALHQIGKTTILEHLLENASQVSPHITIVVGFGAQAVKDAAGNRYHYVEQPQQLGTGHAVLSTKEFLEHRAIQNLVVIPCDHPLIRPHTLQNIIEERKRQDTALCLGTVRVPDFSGDFHVFEHSGRIQRDADGNITGIVEHKDANEQQRQIRELNTSYYCFDPAWLWDNIQKLTSSNRAGEYYLTDLVAAAVEQGRKVAAYTITDPAEAMGANTPAQLEILSQRLKQLQSQ